jgi:CRISPR/Cas system Type II protein with McrA/HNH and RuvC-like nuclease domain
MAADRHSKSNGQGQGMNWIRKDLRLAIYLRDGACCMWCGITLEDGAMLTLDHVHPYSQDGRNGADNLICACSKCNSSRGNRTAAAFAKATAQYINHGVTAKQILAAITEHTAQPIKEFRDEAKQILARRPVWQQALEEASR